MKNFVIGIVCGIIVAVPTFAHAWAGYEKAKPIYGIGCEQGDEYGNGGGCNGTVYVFDDQDNKCYVYDSTAGSGRGGISCVKR